MDLGPSGGADFVDCYFVFFSIFLDVHQLHVFIIIFKYLYYIFLIKKVISLSYRDARLAVRGAVQPVSTRRLSSQQQVTQRQQTDARGAFIHVLKRSISDVNIPLALPAPVEKKTSLYVSKYSDFTRQFAGALRDSQKTVPAPSSVAIPLNKRNTQTHERLTAALQSSLNRVSRAPIVLSTNYMRPVKEHTSESDAELKQAMKSLFGEQSVFVSRANVSATKSAVPFWQRTFELRPFAFIENLFSSQNLQRRSLIIQQLKEVHYGKNNRNNLN